MAQDLLTAIALVLIIEGLLPALSPGFWQKAISDISRLNPRTIRIGGVVSMLAGALLLNALK